MKKLVISFFLVFTGFLGSAQQNSSVSVMDFVKVKDGKKAEAIFYYENNWKLYRDIAIKKKVITSYQLVEAVTDSLNNFDLILITTYADSAQYLKSEENFRDIIKSVRPDGPILLNESKPADFRKNVFAKITKLVFSPDKKQKND